MPTGRENRSGDRAILDIFDLRQLTNILQIPYTERSLDAKFRAICSLYKRVVEFQNFDKLTLRVYGSYLKMKSKFFLNPIFVFRRVDLGG